MDKQPVNMHWLQNNNERPQQQMRPGSSRRPNGSNQQQRPSNTLTGWLLLLVVIMLTLFIFNYINKLNQTYTPQHVELNYTQSHQQLAKATVLTATISRQHDIIGHLKTI